MTDDPMYIVGNTWGALYVAGQATDRWRGFLADIAQNIVHLRRYPSQDVHANIVQAQGAPLLRPKHLYNFYRDFEDFKEEKVPFKGKPA
jgi:hypothetical protein